MDSTPIDPAAFEAFRLHYMRHLGYLTSQALAEKAKSGETPGPAPFGYLNQRTGKVRTTVIVDQAVAPFVKEAFSLAAGAGMPLRAILHRLTDQGLRSRAGKPLQVSGLWYVLSNPFYAGLIRFKGELYPGKHEPLVDKATFDRVQRNFGDRRKRL